MLYVSRNIGVVIMTALYSSGQDTHRRSRIMMYCGKRSAARLEDLLALDSSYRFYPTRCNILPHDPR